MAEIQKLRAIDYDRGVIISCCARPVMIDEVVMDGENKRLVQVPLRNKAGVIQQQEAIEVFMYCDEPGVYYVASGNRVSEKLAAEAGFDVARFRKMRQRKTALDTFLSVQDGEEKETLAEKDGFKLVRLGPDRFLVINPEGVNVAPRSVLSKEAAEQLFTALTEIEDDETADSHAAAVAPVDGRGRVPRRGRTGEPAE